MVQNGVPLVDHYELEFFLVGAVQPFQVQPFGKPTPQANGTIQVLLSSILAAFPSPGIVYQSAVAAVGPGGAARSARIEHLSVFRALHVCRLAHGAHADRGSRRLDDRRHGRARVRLDRHE